MKKGDKVALVSRNYPEWIVVFFAVQLLGGVCVCVNAWLEESALVHCLVLTEPKVCSLNFVFEGERKNFYRWCSSIRNER